MDKKIIDVARAAGVSPATVSRVLNNRELVKEKTREKVLQAIRDMNYHPNAAAKQLRSQRTMTIGVIVPGINVSLFAEIIKGVQNKAESKGYHVIICDYSGRKGRERDYFALLHNRTVDALIFVAPEAAPEIFAEEADKGFTIGVIGRQIEHDSIPCCYTDNAAFSVEVVQHFVRQGHRQIAFIGGYPEATDAFERLEGYMKALHRSGIGFQPALIENGDFSEEGGYRAFLRLREKGHAFTAVYAANDEMALGVYKACSELGIRIPEELAVFGVDNNRISRYITPHLSTVEQPSYLMGSMLAEKLLSLLGEEKPGPGEAADSRIEVKSRLIIRESSTFHREGGSASSGNHGG
ncbi:LacI family DNA-binding transcriptional regulator [Paenibacillus mucilaginosus]|uniref:Transcriptional regulator, LacI family n=1 Tax=Paenibacillus mucilaginosus (strain KNP414) TaxID=1036673 RepID=F8F822_PAEMK|nr:LacI family DNA-binding transcriptional regulator [Paenibacillus mucilaginosus]AEI41007.1 transcriptional regulator, LacI family [Paenibacillus mucilaginosus KNP414]MCG7211548.1 LacI family transcriptional regulator [Paenibacillus mucilaginosus]WDM30082.1 LacI family DNA-binding transcriptional regulator [Paenibacillus mucilaginosus]